VKIIFFDVPVLESIWVHAYWHQVFLHLLQVYAPKPTEFDPLTNPEFRAALPFLANSWLKDVGHAESNEWPSDAARPDQQDSDPNVRAANNLFFRMVGFALLHETAHIVLNHTGDFGETKDGKLRKEYEADAWACHWALDHWRKHDNNPAEFVRRAVPIAFTLTLQSALDLHVVGEKIHPSTPDRLLHFLEQFVWFDASLADHHIAVELAVRAVIDSHLAIAGQPLHRERPLKEHLQQVRPLFV
jgi:hypothetical protein